MKTYTEDQMKDAFEQSRLTHPMVGFKYDTFEDFIKTIPVSLSEREQPVKEGSKEVSAEEMKYLCTRFAHECRLKGATTNNDTCNLYDSFIKEFALSSHSHLLSPCKEKWISETEKYGYLMEANGAKWFVPANSMAEATDIISRHFERWNFQQHSSIQVLFPSPPTGDNKKGEGNG